MFKNMKIGTKLLISVLAINFIAIFFIISILSYESTTLQKKAVDANAESISMEYAAKIQEELSKTMQSAKTIAETFSAMKENNVISRAEYANVLKGILKKNKQFLSVWSVWEKNALDNNDINVQKNEYNNETGRFTPGFNWNNNNIEGFPTNEEDLAKEDYYQSMLTAKKEIIMDPYFDSYSGDESQKILMTSIMVPVFANGQYVAEVGIDIDLAYLNKITNEFKPMGGYAILVSNTGARVAHKKKELLGRIVGDDTPEIQKELLDAVKTGKTYTFEKKSLATNALSKLVYSPVTISSTETPWSVAVVIPVDEIMKDVKEMRNFAFILALISVFIIGFVLYLISKNISGIINTIKNTIISLTENIVNGKLGKRADTETVTPEFRPLIEGFNNIMDAYEKPLNMASSYIKNIAEGNIPEKITENYNGDFNEIKSSINTLINNISLIITGISRVSGSINNGNLNDRGDGSKFKGDWAKLVININTLIDTLVEPLKMTAGYFDKVSKGEIPQPVTKEYKGDFDKIKTNINDAVKALQGLEEGARILKQVSVNNYTEEVKGEHKGVYNDIQNAANDVIARLVNVQNIVVRISEGDLSDLETLQKVGKRSKEDKLVPAFITMIQSLKRLIKGVNEFADYSAEGELSKINLDEASVNGAYREIFTGLNKAVGTIIEPLSEVVDILKEMESGDLRNEIKGNYNGIFLTLKTTLNNTISAINQILSEVSMTTDQVSNGSAQVANASQMLSQGATEQASSLEEISSSMKEIASQTKVNAQNASQSNTISDEAMKAADKGTKQMGELLSAMKEIQSSSNEISKIIKVIDEIAFQTNLLALNAAVEAARAGTHGKGFAVVAEEVRNLAARSAKAAKETGEMIENAVLKSNTGANMSQQTNEVLSQIVTLITKVSDIVGEIAAASNEQAQGVSQINVGLNQVEQVTQQNTASAEESAAASEELSSQAATLREMVSRFKIRNASKSFDRRSSSSGIRHHSSQNEHKFVAHSPKDIIDLD